MSISMHEPYRLITSNIWVRPINVMIINILVECFKGKTTGNLNAQDICTVGWAINNSEGYKRN